ncbi:undecaprenyl-diphosphate phosphatase [Kitasatospora aureofaciens]|uniref:Undecaprenyl-diphosphatase n=1 Tax=Kitasatospora aureofaciens TaxID=1894 RepID=A0A1E7N151_KITAU|nr:undecaprenyl-diphosphate phosphatase [Kitasatospora aureofaciens]QEV00434.1 undecaprenyl-diphosphate phosphatase [Streptomyces viridifaciens]ARF79235.1 undecaprenyl-diphosphatase [Kitasatospora aureofaciens]OEV34417.1 undecaprenyl-diphosphatase [Kitasatospora aureofaciens]UKZ06677.1 undecaprenyl-diphosphate phosphatase [Streptomyces viridifaciens]GGU67868.1 undecaprenyl-diphosphatase [Kitasatospora aureofaciens]
MSTLTYPEAIGVGLLQGVTELFPVSSLGHSILLPAVIGGKIQQDLDMTADGSSYLAALVALHLATALALVVFFWRDWVRVVSGLFGSIRHRRVQTRDEKLAWLLIISTIPVGVAGLVLEKALRHALGKPVPAAVFLALNGLVLLGAERLKRGGSGRRRAGHAAPVDEPGLDPAVASDVRLTRLGYGRGAWIGAAQILALFPGISRSGVTMSAGILRGLHHEDAARFSFLLATPVILAASVLKVPELFKPENSGVLGPVAAGSLAAFVAGYVSVRFLTRYFETRSLTPFAVYCFLAGVGSAVYLSL